MTLFQVRAVCALFVVFVAGTLSAQNLAEDVLKGKEIQGIEFKSYVGPHKVIESRLAIQGIGTELGTQLKAGGTAADYGGKYRLTRLVDPASALLSADLFVLDATAGVDHIRNLNWILSAYLQQAFGYALADADLLADFITRYNAFYRGKTDYFPQYYSPLITAALVPPESAGLALDYRDWPGKTRMLIPLRSSLSKGVAGSVNTEEISNKAIVTDMGTDQAAIDARKKLADLKEGEIVQEQKAIAQKEATQTAATGGQTPKTNSSDPQTSAATSGTGTSAGTTPPNAVTSGAAASTAAATDLGAAKAAVAQRDQALQAERKDIVAADQKKVDTPVAVVAPVKPLVLTPVVLVNESTKLGQVVLVDPAANKLWKKSDLNSVRAARVQVFGDGLLVTAGDTKGVNGAVRLVLLNKDDATVVLTGTDDVSPDAPVLVNGNQILTLTKGDKGSWVLGLFDAKLKTTAKGTDGLAASTAITVGPSGIFVQGTGGKLMLLDAKTLIKKSDTEG
ncbi:MAG: P83/100 family protein [Spirochaetales bacterium]